MEQQGNLNSREAQEVRQRSEFLKRVTDFAQFMQKEYIEPSDGEMSLFISAGDATLNDKERGGMECVMGQHAQIAVGLASMMSDEKWQPVFQLARRMADDYTDLDDRRAELRRRRLTIAVSTLWTLVLAALLVFSIVMHRSPLVTITSILLMTVAALDLYSQWKALQRDRRRLSADEHDHARNRIDREVAQAMQRFFARFRSEQDGEEE
jgi:hypothetical protein